ncbi:MAG: hypothetical protein GY861_03570 [bacterium]|nr:hypothetical protein [bacterium]
MDTGLSSSSYSVSELLTSLRLRTIESQTVLSEEDRRLLFKERILKQIQELLTISRYLVKNEQRKQLLVETQLQAEAEAVQ